MNRCIATGCYKLFRKMSIFTQKFDPITGSTAWEVQDPDYDYHQEVARSAFADMLHDHERNEKYYTALKAAIDQRHSEGRKANVLDIGTGTGLLSMMAAKCGADSIIACEAFRPMANCAVKIIEENGYGSMIKLVRKRSTEMTIGDGKDMPCRANILVTEVFDTELIGEGALSTFDHAHRELLEKDSLVVPSAGTVWVQLIESDHVRAWNRINPLLDPDSGETLIVPPESTNVCPGAPGVPDIQLSQLPRKYFSPLLKPQPMFKFDWTGKEPIVFDETVTIRDKATAGGTAHAVFVWWDLTMDAKGEVLLSCAPSWAHPDAEEHTSKGASLEEVADLIPWRDHWMQAVYYLPEERKVELGEEIALVGSHDEYTFTFKVEVGKEAKKKDESKLERPYCDCWLHLAYSRTRIGQMNDKRRNDKYTKVLRKRINPDTICLCLSDGSIFGLIAASLGAKKVIFFEPSYSSRKTLESFVKANRLESRVTILESLDELTNHEKPDLVLGDPHYGASIYPWDNLRFWFLASRFTKLPRIPVAAKIRAVAVQFKDLHKIRSPLGVCEGFNLTTFDEFVKSSSVISDNPVETHPLWEYPGIALGQPFDLGHLDLTEDAFANQMTKASGRVPFETKGSCNGIAIWLDWFLDQETIVSTGPTSDIVPGQKIAWDFYTRQGVFLLRNIVDVDETKLLSWAFSHRADLTLQCNFFFEVVS